MAQQIFGWHINPQIVTNTSYKPAWYISGVLISEDKHTSTYDMRKCLKKKKYRFYK